MSKPTITILIPVLNRPGNAAQVVNSIRETSGPTHEIVFLVSPDDPKELAACEATGSRVVQTDWVAGPGDYSRKMNLGYQETGGEFMLLAADDLRFHHGWDTELLKAAEATGAAVIGSNDMGNPEVTRKQLFSTHPLVRRDYVDKLGGSADGPGVLCHEGYDHNYVDRELWDVAQARGLTAFAPHARIEHLHPHWGKSKMDSTYTKGLAEFHDDQRLYWSRHELWGGRLGKRERQELDNWNRKQEKLKR